MGTFIQEKQTTWGEFFTDLYDVFANQLANWSVTDEGTMAAVGSPQENTGWFVVEHPDSAVDNFRFYYSDTSGNGTGGYLRIWYGDWDATGSTWNETYQSPDDHNNGLTAAENNVDMDPSEPIEYSMQYRDEGVVFGIRRMVGDGQDGALAFGFAEIQPIWDFHSANQDEGEFVWFYHAREDNGYDRWSYATARGRQQAELNAEDNLAPGQVFKTPVRDFPDHATWTDMVIYSSQYQDSNGDMMPIGTQNLWLETAHGDRAYGDTIEVGATPTYYYFTWDVAYIAIRMD